MAKANQVTDKRRQTTDSRPKAKIGRQILGSGPGIFWRDTSHEPRATNKAFTIIELVVAIALMVMVVSFAGVIFKVSIDSHRVTAANAEIMQKMRAITDQLNTDFRGLRKNAPLLIWFQQDPCDTSQRFDQIRIFADGDFQSTQLYRDKKFGPRIPYDTGTPIKGNVARIDYGLARGLDPEDEVVKDPWDLKEKYRLLARRQHILTADADLDQWPDPYNISETFNDDPAVEDRYKKNEIYEHDSLSLPNWQTVHRAVLFSLFVPTSMGGPDVCRTLPSWVNMGDPNGFHKLMCNDVGSFAVQWAYWDPYLKRLLWFASDDPAGNLAVDSHFRMTHPTSIDPAPNQRRFGVFFAVPHTGSPHDRWYPIEETEYKTADGTVRKFKSNFYPKALKFTFKLYDSKGIIRGGRTFTHIVYIGD